MASAFVPELLLNPPLPGRAETLGWARLHGSAAALAVAEAAQSMATAAAAGDGDRQSNAGVTVVVLEDSRQLQVLESELGFFLGNGAGDGAGAADDAANTVSDSAADSTNPTHPTNPPAIPVLAFPGWECLPYDVFSPPPHITSERLRILSALPSANHSVLLTTCANLMQRLPPVAYIAGQCFELQRGQRIDMHALRERLGAAHYAAVRQVMAAGEFALRGGLVDIFPVGADLPFRLDLFDDEIESIKYFDPDTQRSGAAAERISLLPAREFPLTEASIQLFREAFRREFEGDPRAQKTYTEVSRGQLPAGIEFFFPLFFERTATLFDYLDGGRALWILPANLDQTARLHWAEIDDRHRNANVDIQRRVLRPSRLYLSPRELRERLSDTRRVMRYAGTGPSGRGRGKTVWKAATAPPPELPVEPRDESPYQHFIAHLRGADGSGDGDSNGAAAGESAATVAGVDAGTTITVDAGTVTVAGANATTTRQLISVETAGRREAMEGILAQHGLTATPCANFAAFIADPALALGLCVYPLERGLRLPAHGVEVIAESQLYGEKVFRHRRAGAGKAQDPEAVIRSLAELSDGDPVVHLEHGVGRYRGLQTLDIDAESAEFVVLEYHGGDKLYVPVLSLHLISRFTGGDPEHAPLHELGGTKWPKARKRAREKAYDVAAELLEIEALRNARRGRAMTVPEADYQAFANRFAFDETPDQLRAILEVRADLESAEPMDRLVCGDVGFGKTEVAMRAAFIAVHNDCQVAILTPTTLLARQHFQTFADRFADLGVTVDMLSRFKTRKEARALAARLKDGAPDIIIGTHRLLEDDIKFRRLGLLIIDEEHRFGVRQKEKIKRMRSQVDLLTLTATPIPRTLNIALAGLRAISLIATAPALRLSIKTFIREWNLGLIREACLREIRRGGQVYFLYNEVRSIERFAADLAELMPEADIRCGHGRMREAELERVMQDFYHQRFNILVCSTIIESGLDVASANTIIIHRADRFGLAQLHQLRGRVGRSHHQAFAYLLIPGRRDISADARKRLDAFAAVEGLGAGFALASHDLEIRGAGELLGETQSGLIDEVGFALYNEYLKMAVASIRENRMPVAEEIADLADAESAEVDLHLPALFPPDYLANTHLRLVLYKRIAGAADARELEELQVETVDRFGALPAAAKNLFRLTALRLRAERLGIRKIDFGGGGGDIEFADQPAIDPGTVLALIEREPQSYRLRASNTLTVSGDFAEPATRVQRVEELLNRLAAG